MLRFLILALFMFCGIAQAADESTCLDMGVLGELFANGKEFMSEAEMLESIEKQYKQRSAATKNKVDIEALRRTRVKQKLVLNYVMTINLNEPEARKTIYLKCKAGEYD